jgi:hypothetical protein
MIDRKKDHYFMNGTIRNWKRLIEEQRKRARQIEHCGEIALHVYLLSRLCNQVLRVFPPYSPRFKHRLQLVRFTTSLKVTSLT